MENIYIELEGPRELLIATLIKDKDTYNPYIFIKAEYGRDALDDIEKSNQFFHVDMDKLPNSLDDIYEWDHRFKDRAVKAYIHIDPEVSKIQASKIDAKRD
jgi:hypothetical protein